MLDIQEYEELLDDLRTCRRFASMRKLKLPAKYRFP